MVGEVAGFADEVDSVGHFGELLNLFGANAFPMERTETVVAAEQLAHFLALEACVFVQLGGLA